MFFPGAQPVQSMFGFRIHIVPDQPKRQLSESVPVTPEFRAYINAWMAVFFGMTNMLEDGVSYRSREGVFMNPRTYAALLEVVQAQNESVPYTKRGEGVAR